MFFTDFVITENRLDVTVERKQMCVIWICFFCYLFTGLTICTFLSRLAEYLSSDNLVWMKIQGY